MNTKNFLLGGIVGGVAYFLLGWLFYGNLMATFFHDHPGTATNVDRLMDHFEWWALILGNLLSGFLIAYVFGKSGVASITTGLITGGILGFLMSSSIDCIMYGTTNVWSKKGMAADIVTFTIMSAIVGAIVGAIMGMGRSRTIPAT
jgi:hypothetical protein